MAVSNTKGFRTRNLRYKRSALASMGYGEIERELSEIIEACDDIRWFQDDEETLLNSLDGDEEAAYEFQMMFSDLSVKAEQLYDALLRCDAEEEYDICTVALIGNRYQCVGFDMIEEDYYSLTSYERELACTEAGKRLMRYTKTEMISIIGQCVGILVAFLDLRQSYDYLKATFDILRDENTSLLQTVRQIDELYERAAEVEFRSWKKESHQFDTLLQTLPERVWLE